MCEQSIIGARASVMVYDDNQKKWIPSGTSSGLSKVQIYHHQQNNTFRVVGRKLQDHEVVINCSILKGLKYNQATATFHQWRDSKFVYGLNFSSQQDAEAFARAMMHALEVLSGRIPAPLGPGLGYDEDMGYRTMTREDAAIMQQNNNTIPNNVISPQTPTSTPQSPPQGHHRTNSAPPVPPPAQQVQPKPNYQQQQSQQGQIYVASQPYNPPQPMYQGQGQNQVTMIPPQAQIPNSQSQPNARNGPIYVPSNVSKVNQQQIMQQPLPVPLQQQQQQIPNPPNMFAPPPMQQQPTQAPLAPPQPPIMNNFGHVQANGGYPAQYGSQIPMPPQVSQVSSPPQAVPPPPDFGNGMSAPAPPQPPAAPMPMGGGGGPPPPPPPMPNLAGSKSNGMDMSSLAAQLQAAKLKKSQTLPKAAPPPAENSGSSTSSGGSGNYGTIGRTTGGMASMMDEMAKTLARRRAQVDKKEPDSNNDESSTRQRPWEKSNTLPHKLGANSNSNNSNSNNTGNGSESPKPLRKRFGSASEETILKQVNGEGFSIPSAIDLENFKADIIQEVKLEIAKAKQEIIEAIKSEFNRR